MIKRLVAALMVCVFVGTIGWLLGWGLDRVGVDTRWASALAFAAYTGTLIALQWREMEKKEDG